MPQSHYCLKKSLDIHWRGGCVEPKAGIKAPENSKFAAPCRQSNLDSLVVQAMSHSAPHTHLSAADSRPPMLQINNAHCTTVRAAAAVF
jgi:hypothetical protein